jgi:dihydroneopterin aldolase
MGRIAIEGMVFYAHHGYYHDEQKLGNRFAVDVYLDTDFRLAAESDNLPETINYEDVWKVVGETMKERAYLLEHVAYNVFRDISARFKSIQYLKVRITKFNPPIPGEVARTFVELDSVDMKKIGSTD